MPSTKHLHVSKFQFALARNLFQQVQRRNCKCQCSCLPWRCQAPVAFSVSHHRQVQRTPVCHHCVQLLAAQSLILQRCTRRHGDAATRPPDGGVMSCRHPHRPHRHSGGHHVSLPRTRYQPEAEDAPVGHAASAADAIRRVAHSHGRLPCNFRHGRAACARGAAAHRPRSTLPGRHLHSCASSATTPHPNFIEHFQLEGMRLVRLSLVRLSVCIGRRLSSGLADP